MAVVVLVIAVGACSDDEAGGGDAGPDVVGDGTDGDTGPSVEAVTLEVVLNGEPVAGAVASFDGPDGARVDGVTNTAGRVTFTDVDWSQGGSVSVTAYAEPWAYSAVGFTEADLAALEEPGVVRVALATQQPEPPTRDVVTVTGELLNRVQPSTSVVLASSTSGPLTTMPGDHSFSGELLRGEPFGLVAVELGGSTDLPRGRQQDVLAWATAQGAAPNDDVSLDLDFAGGVTATTVEGSVHLPEHLDVGLRPAFALATLERVGVEGFSTQGVTVSSAYNTEETGVDYVFEYVLLPGDSPDDFVTRWEVSDDTEADVYARSVAWTPGLPGQGAQVVELLDPPIVSGTGLRLHEPIDLSAVDPGVTVEMLVSAFTAGFGWAIVVGSARPVVIPELPSGIDEETLVGGSPLGLSVDACADVEEGLGECDRWVRIAGLALTR